MLKKIKNIQNAKTLQKTEQKELNGESWTEDVLPEGESDVPVSFKMSKGFWN